MKSRIYSIIIIFLLTGLLMSACTQEADGGKDRSHALSEDDLDAAFSTLLVEMDTYNATFPAALNGMLAEEPPPFLLDVRSVEEIEAYGHIPGAVVIPLRDIGKHIDQLPSFDTTIVSYCGSGWRSTIAATILEVLGWHDSLSLKGNSYKGWMESGYSFVEGVPQAVALNAAEPDAELLAIVDETLTNIPEGWGAISTKALDSEIVENPNIVLIDVRQTEEIQQSGAIAGAIHIPIESFIDRKADWPADKDAKIVIYCGSGHRSIIAMTILWTYGYSNVYSYFDGFHGWVDSGHPVVEYSMQ